MHAGRIPLSPEKHILTLLLFVGHINSSYRDVTDHFGITLSTLFVFKMCKLVKQKFAQFQMFWFCKRPKCIVC